MSSNLHVQFQLLQGFCYCFYPRYIDKSIDIIVILVFIFSFKYLKSYNYLLTSGILLLLLKHLKLNHVYQFEFMSQHLVFANCIPLILKFFNQNIIAYVQVMLMIKHHRLCSGNMNVCKHIVILKFFNQNIIAYVQVI